IQVYKNDTKERSMEKLWYLSQIKLFNHLTKDDMGQINNMTHMSTIPKNTIVQTPFSQPKGLYLVKEGKLRLYNLNSEGKQYTIGIIGHGNTFGNTSLFSLGTQNIYIETLEDTLICLFDPKQLEDYLLSRPQLLMNILGHLSQKIEEQNKMLEQLALYDIKQRTLYWLRKLANDFGLDTGEYITIDLPLSHQELANMIGSTRESVSLILSELSQEGIILSGRLKISISKSKLAMEDGIYEI
ncbi:Crp/Fnr family transcriptional regulator, partial [Petrocella sp. FN5]|uniref:Crp/Fnr family transcriptional regulator n=1 Tax=Petrocella sp. FN5 TaxID=3032002 RepID=UPI0023DBBF40